MKFGVVTFPGSNCDQDMVYTLRNIMGQEVVELWHKDTDLQGVDFVVLPGGFSYGDYLRSGAIAQFSPIMEKVIEFANNGGYVLGICNGFQILCETGLLPGALLHNENQRFICKNIHLKASTNKSLVTANADLHKAYKIPIAHAEGRYFIDNEGFQKLKDNDQILYQYCDKDGHITPDANPNGSVDNIAGVTNEKRNVFGMMPHPERAADEALGNTEGKLMFDSILEHVQQ
ncbi:MAG: phosphoribosylformylglycinamidine synthase subunit PurQ [Salibacter sp.]|uniref:phosphoribosylformylglycinamidine synthase subunit PurQ n=1 Tax=Salibacter sp. TaxID=2010995 RepID=UPI00286FE8A7|nr:phosphoribosylformylglycinamidine synthase subunit PurQ [Salibacter sp.]MDR9399190.1 phosphoribosylformylglycinamidine synthase subunit PurQ [Salibacter sp.]